MKLKFTLAGQLYEKEEHGRSMWRIRCEASAPAVHKSDKAELKIKKGDMVHVCYYGEKPLLEPFGDYVQEGVPRLWNAPDGEDVWFFTVRDEYPVCPPPVDVFGIDTAKKLSKACYAEISAGGGSAGFARRILEALGAPEGPPPFPEERPSGYAELEGDEDDLPF